MQNYVHYIHKNGHIVFCESWAFDSPPTPAGEADSVLAVDTVIEPHRYFIARGALQSKKEMDTRYIKEGLTVTFFAIPEGTTAVLGKKSLVADKDPTEFTFDVPGKYRFWFVDSPQYLDTSVEVILG
jgi:hypothetical protein